MARQSFVKWLHGQALGDEFRHQPYAALYDIGGIIESVLGDGDFDLSAIATELRSRIGDDDLLVVYFEALTHAEAHWRVDALCFEHPEEVATAALLPIPVADPDLAVLKLDPPCGFRSLEGLVCGSPSVPGSARCPDHGGAITDPEVRRSLLLVAYAKLIEGSEIAVNTLIDVAESSRSDMARVQAAKEMLDRAGVVQDQHVHLHTDEHDTDEEDRLAMLKERLNTARDRLRLVAIPVSSTVLEDTESAATG